MKSSPKIALVGPKGGGKTWIITEAAKQLEFKLQQFKVKKDIPPISTLAFADPIYEMQLDLFDYMNQTGMVAREFNEWLKGSGLDNKAHPVIGMTPRGFRQQFGTEFARAKNPAIWVDIMREKIASSEASPQSGIIMLDVRFPNEVELCKEAGFFMIYVNSQGVNEKGSHESESYFDMLKPECNVIVNNNAKSNMVVDEIIKMLLIHIEENYTEAGLIVPKGKIN